MEQMTLTQHFENLGAPLHNPRWSWGAVRDDGVVFLRVWEDEIYTEADGIYIDVDSVIDEQREGHTKLGRLERREHLDLVRQGAPCYLVVGRAKDVDASPRVTDWFDPHELLVVNSVVDWPGRGALVKISGRTTPMTVRRQMTGTSS